jgi:hypothetical protein
MSTRKVVIWWLGNMLVVVKLMVVWGLLIWEYPTLPCWWNFCINSITELICLGFTSLGIISTEIVNPPWKEECWLLLVAWHHVPGSIVYSNV